MEKVHYLLRMAFLEQGENTCEAPKREKDGAPRKIWATMIEERSKKLQQTEKRDELQERGRRRLCSHGCERRRKVWSQEATLITAFPQL